MVARDGRQTAGGANNSAPEEENHLRNQNRGQQDCAGEKNGVNAAALIDHSTAQRAHNHPDSQKRLMHTHPARALSASGHPMEYAGTVAACDSEAGDGEDHGKKSERATKPQN